MLADLARRSMQRESNRSTGSHASEYAECPQVSEGDRVLDLTSEHAIQEAAR